MSTKKRIILAGVLTLMVFPGCSEDAGNSTLVLGGREPESRGYKLVILDTEKEVRQRYSGEGNVPWAGGMTASRFESTVLTTREGFTLPGVFVRQWQEELTAFLVEYRHMEGDAYEDFGWVWKRSSEAQQEDMCVKFKQPLTFWNGGKGRVETSVDTYIMKRDSVSLFDPRGILKGKPEVEGEGTATLVCKDFTGVGDTLRFEYTLDITGQGVLRFFGADGTEWLLGEDETFSKDREEACTMEITRAGTKAYSRDPRGRWYLTEDVFQETWHAESIESDATVHESSLGGAGRTYSMTLSDLPERRATETFAVNVYDYGAAGDGDTLDTAAINAAIEVCGNRGGGTVTFPPGTFLSGSVHMKSHVTLKLEEGAVLKGTRDMREYDPREESPWSDYQDASQTYFHHSLIWGENLENVGFLGPGIIDGSDAFDPWPGMHTSPPPPFGWILSTIMYQIDNEIFQRGVKPISLKFCRNVLIKDLTIVHAPDEAIFFAGCDSVLIDGYTAREVRVDGMDPVCSRNVTIKNCEIKSLDDAIAVKTSYTLGFKRDCEGILVENCLLSTFINALKIGTESVGDFRNLVFRDSTIHNLPGFPSFAGLSMMSVDGGKLDGILFSNITMKNANYPIFIRLGDRLRTPEEPPIGEVGNLLIRNITASGGIGTGASLITAVPGHYAGEGIRLQDVTVTCKGGGHLLSSFLPVPEIRESEGVYPDPAYIIPGDPPAYGFFCRHVKGLEFHNVKVGFKNPDRRAALICEDVQGLVMDGFDAERIPGSAPSVIIRDSN